MDETFSKIRAQERGSPTVTVMVRARRGAVECIMER